MRDVAAVGSLPAPGRYLTLATRGPAPGEPTRHHGYSAWWVAAWLSRLPVVALGGSTPAVARTIDLQGTPEDLRAALRGAGVHLTESLPSLALAAEERTPTVLLLARGQRLPEGAAGHPHLRVLRSPGPSIDEIPVAEVFDAVEHFVPDVFQREGGETAKARQRLCSFLAGRGLDLGHGGCKVTPAAIGVDVFKRDPHDVLGDVRDLSGFRDESFDWVWSSHCLEDLWRPCQALDEWTRVLRTGGNLVLYLPLRGFYPSVGSADANPGHKDDYVPEDVERFLALVGGMEVIHSARLPEERAFELVATKRASRTPTWRSARTKTPALSVVLMAAELPGDPASARFVNASVECLLASAGEVPLEVLLFDGDLHGIASLSVLGDLQARHEQVFLHRSGGALGDSRISERAARLARAEWLVFLDARALPLAGCMQALAQAAAAAAPSTHVLEACAVDLAPGGPPPCIAVRRSTFRAAGGLDQRLSGAAAWQECVGRLGGSVSVAQALVLAGPPLTVAGRLGLHGAEAVAERVLRNRTRAAAAPAQRILVVCLRTLGDCVLATPVLTALRLRHPDAEIAVATLVAYRDVFEGHPAVDEVIVIAGTPPGRDDDLELDERVRRDLAAREEFDRLIFLSVHEHVPRYRRTGASLQAFYAGAAETPEAIRWRPSVSFGEAHRTAVEEKLRAAGFRGGPRIVFHSRSGWALKDAPASFWSALAAAAGARWGSPILVGGPGEGAAIHGVLDLTGRLSIKETTALIASASLFVGPDSGPLHLAGAVGCPVVALFAATHPRVAAPSGPRRVSIQASSCCEVPCGQVDCAVREPCGESFTPDEVLAAMALLLDDPAPRAEELRNGKPARIWFGGAEWHCAEEELALDPALAREPPDPAWLDAPAIEPRAQRIRSFELSAGPLLRRRPPAGIAPLPERAVAALEATLDLLPPPVQVTTLLVLTEVAVRSGDGSLACSLSRLLVEQWATLGRTRPAFRELAGDVAVARVLALRLTSEFGPALATAEREVAQALGAPLPFETLAALSLELLRAEDWEALRAFCRIFVARAPLGHPQRDPMRYRAGFAAEHGGHRAEAAEHYHELASSEDVEPLIRGTAALRLGLLCLAGGRLDDALGAFGVAARSPERATAEVAGRALAAMAARR